MPAGQPVLVRLNQPHVRFVFETETCVRTRTPLNELLQTEGKCQDSSGSSTIYLAATIDLVKKNF